MNLFKAITNWIFSDERKEILRVITDPEITRAFLSKRRIGKSTIVVLVDGTILTKEEDEPTVYNMVTPASTESEIRKLMADYNVVIPPPSNIEKEEQRFLKTENYTSLLDHEDFRVVEGKVYFKSIKLAIPPVILASFIELVEKMKALKFGNLSNGHASDLKDLYNRLSFFWMKIANSPIKDIDNILLFCKTNDVRLSRTGNLIAYRRIKVFQTRDIFEDYFENISYTWKDFVEESYLKIKKWKKSPTKFYIYEGNEGFALVPINKTSSDYGKLLGSLEELNTKLLSTPSDVTTTKVKVGEEVIYTSAHNFGKHTFKIGDVYKISDDEVDTNVGNCASGGLHAASKDYNYGSFGEVPIVVLINPSKAIYVPTSETGKFRTSEMKIACINPNGGSAVHVDDSVIEQADKEYNDFTIDELEKIVEAKEFPEVDGLVPEISIDDTALIVSLLKEKVVKI